MDNDNAPPVDLSDAPDVSLIDTPMNQALDTPDTTADEPDTAADTEDTSSNETPDAKDTEATSDAQDTDKDAPDTQTAEQPKTPQTKEERDQIARQAYQERQRTRQQIAQQIDKEYAPKTEAQLVEEGTDPNDAKFEALRQEMTFAQERTRVAELNANMRAEAVEVTHDFPIFDQNSPDYDEAFTKEVEASYAQAARLQMNEDKSMILSADASLYEHYQRMYNIYSRGTSRGTEAGQQQMAAQMAQTTTPGGSSSTNGPAPGSLEELEKRLGDVSIL